MNKCVLVSCSIGLGLASLAARAQTPLSDEEQSEAMTEVIVTARKRAESLMNVPVFATSISGEALQRLQTNDLKSLASIVPGLSMGTSVLSVGQLVSLRGVGTSALDPGVDASVTLNIDGLALSQGLAYSSGMFDVGQIEVLKGPQNLFYGKSSPGGVISLTTADPTADFEVIARAGYEVEARNRVAEGIVSGPLGETLRARLAMQYGALDGFFRNDAEPPAGTGATDPAARNGGGKYYKIRGTLLFNPSESFDARVKLNRAVDDIENGGALQNVLCPEGVNAPLGRFFVQPTDKCKLDRYAPSNDQLNSAFPAFADTTSSPGNKNVSRDGVPYNRIEQTFGTAELNVHFNPELTLTSQTGYYRVDAPSLFNGTAASHVMGLFDVANDFDRRQFNQELRLTSDFDTPLNLTVGGFLERGEFSDDVTIARNIVAFPLPAGSPPSAIYISKGLKKVKIRTESVFGQLLYKITPELELAAGARWTDERRSEVGSFLNTATGVTSNATFVRPEIEAKNVAPELSLTYRPDADTTLFANLKRGYKSGSFNVSTPPFNGEDNSFDDEEVQGGDVGIKKQASNGRLRFESDLFYYKYSGLQVGANALAANGVAVTRTVNAGSARSYGIETSVNYRPEKLDALTLRAGALFNDTRYTKLTNVPCYSGQLISEGCNLLFSPLANSGLGGFTAQERSGLPLVRSPEWSGNFGFDYEIDVGRELTLVLSNNNQWQSKSLVNLGYTYYQKSFVKADLAATLQGVQQRWEVALIGKNLNNEITTGNCINGNRMGANAGGSITGSTVRGPAGIDEISCWADAGRSVWVRGTWHY